MSETKAHAITCYIFHSFFKKYTGPKICRPVLSWVKHVDFIDGCHSSLIGLG